MGIRDYLSPFCDERIVQLETGDRSGIVWPATDTVRTSKKDLRERLCNKI